MENRLKTDVYGRKRQTSNRILMSTVSCSNLGQFVLYCTVKLKHELTALLPKTCGITFKYLPFDINVNLMVSNIANLLFLLIHMATNTFAFVQNTLVFDEIVNPWFFNSSYSWTNEHFLASPSYQNLVTDVCVG